MSGISSALDVPIGGRDMEEKIVIYQRVMNGVPAVTQLDVEAFCGRGYHCTGVNGASRNGSLRSMMTGTLP